MYAVDLDLNCFSLQISDLPLRLNLDLLETNVINIVLLFSGLLYLGSDVLSKTLFKRQQEIAIEFLSLVRQVYNCQVRVYKSRKKVLDTLRPYVRDGFYKSAGLRFRELNSIYGVMTNLKIDNIRCCQIQEILDLEQKDYNLMSDYVVSRVLERVKSIFMATFCSECNFLRCYVISSIPLQLDKEGYLVDESGIQQPSKEMVKGRSGLAEEVRTPIARLPIVNVRRLGNSSIYELFQLKQGTNQVGILARLHREYFMKKVDMLMSSIKEDNFSYG